MSDKDSVVGERKCQRRLAVFSAGCDSVVGGKGGRHRTCAGCGSRFIGRQGGHAVSAEFSIGDKAVYPSQGVAEIVGIEKKEIFGKIQRFYVLRALDSGLRILVPLDKAEQVGLRRVADKDEIQEV